MALHVCLTVAGFPFKVRDQLLVYVAHTGATGPLLRLASASSTAEFTVASLVILVDMALVSQNALESWVVSAPMRIASMATMISTPLSTLPLCRRLRSASKALTQVMAPLPWARTESSGCRRTERCT